MNKLKAAMVVLLVAPAFGFTNGEYFDTVTRPDRCNQEVRPSVGMRYFDAYGGDVIRFGNSTETINGDRSCRVSS